MTEEKKDDDLNEMMDVEINKNFVPATPIQMPRYVKKRRNAEQSKKSFS